MEMMSPDEHVEAIVALMETLPWDGEAWSATCSSLFAVMRYPHAADLVRFDNRSLWQIAESVADRLVGEEVATSD